MKKLYTLVGASLFSTAMFAQASFSDDFEGYTVGQYIGAVSPNWTTWNNVTGGPEDTQVNNTMNNTPSGSNSIRFFSDTVGGGPQDCVLPFGGQYNTGEFVYQMDVFIEPGKGAYFNFQANTTVGQVWAMECYMNQLGDMYMSNTNGQLAQTTCPLNQWFTLKYDIKLNTNVWDVYINNVLVSSFGNTVNQIASIDIFASNLPAYGGNSQADYYIDNVSYTHTPYALPTVNLGITALGAINPATRAPAAFTGIVGQSRQLASTVRNLGTNAITSFDISYNYNSGTINQTVSAVNIASLASYQVLFTTPATLAAGSHLLSITISNVNGAGADGDPTDDVGTQNVTITTVPAPGKIVVGEEGTGTWCQWCPRGAVFNDYMENTYSGYWAGIAVHDAASDPMTIPAYDAAVSALIPGYPSELVDRNAAIDPSAVETSFMTEVAIPPVATLVNGATYNAGTGQLDVSVTYTFSASANSGYKVACVLTEDGITGVGAGYSQQNAYHNNSAGMMGGFELLNSPVSYALMTYDHVARAISPSFAGGTGFAATVNPADVVTFNYTFMIPSTWNINNMHIIGMLIKPTGIIDNGSTTTIAQAITNGYIAGVPTAALPGFSVNVFPNPTDGDSQVKLDLATSQEVVVTITDVTGKVIASRNYGEMIGQYVLPIETAGLASGIYMVEVRTGDSVNTTKLIVR